MKSINRIVILTLAAVAIVMFWLAPGINQATAVEYTRIYEDTDYPEPFLKDTTKKEKTPKPPKGSGRLEDELEKKDKVVKESKLKDEKMSEASGSAKPAKKIYKRQTIRPKDKKFKLEAKMFSRAVQFVEEYDSTKAAVEEDSITRSPNL